MYNGRFVLCDMVRCFVIYLFISFVYSCFTNCFNDIYPNNEVWCWCCFWLNVIFFHRDFYLDLNAILYCFFLYFLFQHSYWLVFFFLLNAWSSNNDSIPPTYTRVKQKKNVSKNPLELLYALINGNHVEKCFCIEIMRSSNYSKKKTMEKNIQDDCVHLFVFFCDLLFIFVQFIWARYSYALSAKSLWSSCGLHSYLHHFIDLNE